MIEDSQIINMFNHIYYETHDKGSDEVRALITGLDLIKATYVIQWLSRDKIRVWCDQDDFDILGELDEKGE
jgi:hypothetical protein